jgi:hypothetical protein
VERTEPLYREIAEMAGHTFSFHSGSMAGRRSVTLANLVRGVDLVVIVTDVNSHGAAQCSRRLARRHGVPAMLLRRCSPSRFAEIASTLSAAPARAWHCG